MAGRNKALTLYKSILRAHDKFLPVSMKQLGDAYVKSEFRLHKTAKAEQTSQFFIEWEKYLQHIERTGRGKQSMDVGLVDVPPQQQQQHQQQQQVVVNNVTSSSSSSSSTMGLDHRQNNNNGNGGGMSFGKDVPKGVAFNEEQESQLEKLREEAVKAGKEHGGGGGGGGR